MYDELKEKGNKHFYKGLYKDALVFYEKAYSCLKYLEIVDDDEDFSFHKKFEEQKIENENALSIIQRKI